MAHLKLLTAQIFLNILTHSHWTMDKVYIYSFVLFAETLHRSGPQREGHHPRYSPTTTHCVAGRRLPCSVHFLLKSHLGWCKMDH